MQEIFFAHALKNICFTPDMDVFRNTPIHTGCDRQKF